ncbi:MAG: polyprenyl synthetase family protein [Candidatus Zixiibacteriota bacterium]|nr:MAG: polyprenyl synthetase family protein [candidate division Zixibacteria bacterium]
MDSKRLQELTKPVQADLTLFDRRLTEFLKGDSPLITSIAQHLLKSRGKRIRPAFLFLASRAAEYYNEHTVNASLAIELIHTATLLHDDVVDNSDLRRGEETVNFKWTNLISVLMGDYLFAKAFRLMVETSSMALIDAISRATERVSVGELRQIEETSNYDLSEEEYLKIIADKTASLFAVACEAGPILARQNGRERRRFAEFGEKIGVAFQITDDLLDYVGSARVTGKEPGNDLITGKVTLPLIYSLHNGDRAKNKEILRILGNGVNKGCFMKVLKYITETGGIDYAYRRAAQIAREGLDAVKGLQDSVYYQSLRGMVDYSTSRAA